MAAKKGKNCKVALGTDKVLGIGNWSLSGISSDMLEDTEFGDDYKTYEFGLKDGGTITFNGYYDPEDSSGQDALREANEKDTDINDLRLYVDDNSYWTPRTTGPLSHVNITSWDVNADKSGLMQCSFTAKVSGAMELV